MLRTPNTAPVGSPRELVKGGSAWKARYRYDDPSTSTRSGRVFITSAWPRPVSSFLRARRASAPRPRAPAMSGARVNPPSAENSALRRKSRPVPVSVRARASASGASPPRRASRVDRAVPSGRRRPALSPAQWPMPATSSSRNPVLRARTPFHHGHGETRHAHQSFPRIADFDAPDLAAGAEVERTRRADDDAVRHGAQVIRADFLSQAALARRIQHVAR